MSGDKPYYNLAVPLPLTSFAQEKLGMLELDSVDGTAIVSHGDIFIDNGCSLMSFNTSNTPSLSFNGSSLNVSATTVSLNGGLVLSNVSNVSHLGVNFSQVVPSSSLVVPWYQSGGLYVTSVSNTENHVVNVLCVMP
jgi:hypothetical protein